MEQTFDLPDSTDWLDTPLSLVAPLESSLRCQVCKDFFDNPVITSCSHTFCSLCIRRCLSTEGKCPACRSPDQELKLRRNWAVQELVEAFQNARASVLDLARKAAAAAKESESEEGVTEPVTKKRKVQAEGADNGGAAPEGVRTRSRARGANPHVDRVAVEVIDDTTDEEYVPEDGLVACPICSRRMKNEAVFRHLDSCNGAGAPAPPKPVSFGSLQPMSPASRKTVDLTNKPLERLPIINYSLLKDNVLRKKLKDLGIPNTGPRPILQRRHTEWMNLWNANCDSRNPKLKRELLRELDIWERTQGGHAQQSGDTVDGVMRKDFDAAAWSTSHDDDFKRLIANARKKKDAAMRPKTPEAPAPASQPDSLPILEATEATVPTHSQPPEPLPVESSAVSIAEHEVPVLQETCDSKMANAHG
ncbi:postreplication repair E3 ubiquitin-protein ligase rad18 [Aspergillus heteromorphus CBS 117.55]|uniref:Postreplication repair E3 ubiquitin-protein ligase RAD18 n=1 Tax=Aspergillus heteromorphus CBS 117.55 TaxID=1448321 RepID=A0A317WQY2_9EURO|nr:postreplication repair E3 ubiquitin-protein ligase rad18 [Aspergillus heteromorphus CBS 117.55]PWY87527.1 postreplication repair E3 ubiquitin-protein ligase rad18 [Aspergillus heteromorphus CBS 117.55]